MSRKRFRDYDGSIVRELLKISRFRGCIKLFLRFDSIDDPSDLPNERTLERSIEPYLRRITKDDYLVVRDVKIYDKRSSKYDFEKFNMAVFVVYSRNTSSLLNLSAILENPNFDNPFNLFKKYDCPIKVLPRVFVCLGDEKVSEVELTKCCTKCGIMTLISGVEIVRLRGEFYGLIDVMGFDQQQQEANEEEESEGEESGGSPRGVSRYRRKHKTVYLYNSPSVMEYFGDSLEVVDVYGDLLSLYPLEYPISEFFFMSLHERNTESVKTEKINEDTRSFKASLRKKEKEIMYITNQLQKYREELVRRNRDFERKEHRFSSLKEDLEKKIREKSETVEKLKKKIEEKLLDWYLIRDKSRVKEDRKKIIYDGYEDEQKCSGVCLGTLDGKKVVVKTIREESNTKYHTLREVLNIADVYEDGKDEVVKFHGYFKNKEEFCGKEADVVKLVLERYDCDLREFIQERKKDLNILDKVRIMLSMAKCLQFLHDRKILHGDVKPGNFLVKVKDDKERKSFCLRTISITDFGLSNRLGTEVEHVSTKSSRYTFCYRPPEGWMRSQDRVFTKESDIWALGLCFFQLISGTDIRLWMGYQKPLQNWTGTTCDSYEIPRVQDRRVMNLLEGMMPYDPKYRMSITDVVSFLMMYEEQIRKDKQDLKSVVRLRPDVKREEKEEEEDEGEEENDSVLNLNSSSEISDASTVVNPTPTPTDGWIPTEPTDEGSSSRQWFQNIGDDSEERKQIEKTEVKSLLDLPLTETQVKEVEEFASGFPEDEK